MTGRIGCGHYECRANGDATLLRALQAHDKGGGF
jgi:hypothetical protein